MNRAERRTIQKKGKNLLELLKEAAEKSSEDAPQTEQDDLNILPLPIDQRVEDDSMLWIWLPSEDTVVLGRLYTKHSDGYEPGDYIVELSMPKAIEGVHTESFILNNDGAKVIGQCLVSAWNYKNIWKEHAGDFLERQLMTRTIEAPAEDDEDEEESDGVVGEPLREPVLYDG